MAPETRLAHRSVRCCTLRNPEDRPADKRVPLLTSQLPLVPCLSRACLGKSIVFKIKVTHQERVSVSCWFSHQLAPTGLATVRNRK
jgi:hypothetical protein